MEILGLSLKRAKMNEQNNEGDKQRDRSYGETYTQSRDHQRKMGATPKSTIGWAASGACASALLYLLSQINSIVDDRVDKKLDPVKAVNEYKFKDFDKQLNDNSRRIEDLEKLVNRGKK